MAKKQKAHPKPRELKPKNNVIVHTPEDPPEVIEGGIPHGCRPPDRGHAPATLKIEQRAEDRYEVVDEAGRVLAERESLDSAREYLRYVNAPLADAPALMRRVASRVQTVAHDLRSLIDSHESLRADAGELLTVFDDLAGELSSWANDLADK